MSYILDALRKSQAERERGQVPGLDAQPEPAARPTAEPAHASRAGGLLAGAGLGLALALGAAWWWRPTPAPVAAAAAVATVTASAAALPAPVPVPIPAALPTSLPVSSSPATSLPATSLPATSLPASLPAPSPKPLPVVVSAPQPSPTSHPPSTSPRAPPVAQPAPRPIPLGQLTAEQRRELPAMVLGGSIWSESAQGRFVIVNGQVVREGEAAAPSAIVEQIEPRRVLVRWRGLQLELPL